MTSKSREKSPARQATLKTTPIAVIGIGSIFPGANQTQVYWDNILRKIDSITDVPASRWKIDDYYDPDPSAPDKSYCKRGGFIPDIDFDPMEFGLPPNILEVTDVSQLISLAVARDALQDAGYGEDRPFDREHTGCILGFVGTSSKLFTPLMTRLQYPVWEKVLRSAGISEGDTNKIIEKIKLAYVGWEENSFPGAIGNVVTGRICNRFDLGGTNCVVDAACASSLAAVRMAVAELIEGRASMMITGGIDTDNSINSYLCFSKTPAFTQKENVRSFDAESGGMMVGEGLGMIVLKRLEDAERDGDRVYAVIQAIGTSSDGRFKSIYAPRPSGQAQALRRAYAEAGFEPATVGMIEAHGTGTVAGDPAEFEGLKEVFGENNERRQYIALGSVKSQIGHTKAAAGVASLIKTSLALYHKVLPPTINVTRPNPKLGIDQTPFYLNTETRPWIRAKNGYPRRAGVSSFGFGGTNFHVVLEEAQDEHTDAYRLNTVPQPVLLSAAAPAQLLEACRNALKDLQGDLAQASFNNLVRASRTLSIPQGQARIGFVAETVDEAREMLKLCIDWLVGGTQQDSWEHPKGIFYRRSGLDPQGKVVALFSGQGSQYLDMGRELAVNFPPVREVFGAVDEMFIQDELEPLSSHVYPRPVFTAAERESLAEKLTRTEHAQPAIGSLSVGLYKLLQQGGFKPDFVAGHSFGELTALWAAGVLSEHDYYLLAKARGKAMAPPSDPDYDAGTMAAVKGDVEQIRAALASDPEVTLANWNSNDQVVIAGPKTAVSQAQMQLERQGFKVIPLPVSAAFHTALVGHAQKPFAKAIQSVKFNRPRVPVYSNSTAQAHSEDARSIQSALAEHILKPVLFRDEIQNIYAAGGSIFVEFGPKNVLTNLVSNILAGKPHLAVALNANAKKDSDRQLREAVIALRVAGLPLTNFDPYAVEAKMSTPRKKSPVTIRLNGGFYVSEKTRSAFEKALNDGFKIQAQPAPQAPQPAITHPPVEPAPRVLSVNTLETPAMNATSNGNAEQFLADYQAHQSETLRLHEQYLRTEEEYASAFAQLIQLQSELVSKSVSGVNGLQSVQPLFESLERSMMRFHEHQAETLRIHQRYLETQERFSNSYIQTLTGEARVTAPATAPVMTLARPVTIPASTPVAISVPAVEPIAPKSNGSEPVAAPVQPPVKAAAPAAAGVSAEQLKAALLSIVSEKTGYPVETLELDMDMEADLGIDSIKRVEILGAMQTQFPELPQVDNTMLAELRTLGQIVDQFSAGEKLLATLAAPAADNIEQAVAASAPTAVHGSSEVDLTAALLSIVSEKTGYPVETLELEMDMEADLGIDSIKRVEILGAMQARFPELPQVNNSTLAELRTLGQITQAMAGGSALEPAARQDSLAAPAVLQDSEPVTGDQPIEAVQSALLSIVSEKTGYPVETLELDMDMEADLGIDSIKRVEILGALQAQFPELPQVDNTALSELRTLGQIIEFMSSAASGTPSAEVTAASPFDGAVNELDIEQGVVIRKLLPAPDYMEFSLPEQHVCLVTDEGTSTTPMLVQSLLSKGWPVVVMRLPETITPRRLPLPDGAGSVVLQDLSEACLEARLAEVKQRFGPVAVFVHLDVTNDDGATFSAAEKSLVKLVFLTAKHLKEQLNQAAQNGRAAFLSVSRMDGEFGLGEGANYTPVSGGTFGLVKTLNLEWDEVFCRAIDISPALHDEQAVERILAELHDPNRLVAEVGYTIDERSTLVIASVPVTGGNK